jgi:sulfate transport system ATP-binding protein
VYIEFKHINKSFGDFQASKDVSFGIEKGKMIALLGPSGSGKTTILRMIAGLEKQDSGDIYIDGRLVNNTSPSERKVGFMFQNYALFPWLNVHDNIAYGLKIQKKTKEEINKRVKELLELVNLPDVEKRYPDQLSGGQKQRIALARALAPNPEVLLLDEPFAAIDAKIRKELRTWLRETISKVGVTTIFVTHDQEEAVEVSDEIVVTNEGRVEQIGTPRDIYLKPKTPFVAQFIGQSAILNNVNRIKGFEMLSEGSTAVVRPEFIDIFFEADVMRFQSATHEGTIRHVSFYGERYELVAAFDGFEVKVAVPLKYSDINVGDRVKIIVNHLLLIKENSVQEVYNKIVYSEEDYAI